jgi:hypothetical protein
LFDGDIEGGEGMELKQLRKGGGEQRSELEVMVEKVFECLD